MGGESVKIDEREEQALLDGITTRFVRYAKVCTTSDKTVEATPSTPGQWELAKMLVGELNAIGLTDVELTDHCYVLASLPSNIDSALQVPVIGFLAHLDTAGEVSGKDVGPQIITNYNGGKIILNDNIVLDPEVETGLAAQKGGTIIHTDGTTLLGADDKAGIAEIVSAAAFLIRHPEIKHGGIEIIFSPDEETGKGLPCFPLEKIKSTACWTLDGGPLGELEIECFNACSADISFYGKVIHPGSARGILVNAALMAAVYAAMLPRNESPEATDGYYGYYCVMNIAGNEEKASLELIVRDFTQDGMRRRITALDAFAKAVEAQFPGGKVCVNAKESYRNMKEKIEEHPRVLAKLKEAAALCGVDFKLKPIRGGTDGSRLTELGIPTPNIWTGGRNFHSKGEWVSAGEMLAACKLIIELAAVWAKK